jgi:hypothetical protein
LMERSMRTCVSRRGACGETCLRCGNRKAGSPSHRFGRSWRTLALFIQVKSRLQSKTSLFLGSSSPSTTSIYEDTWETYCICGCGPCRGDRLRNRASSINRNTTSSNLQFVLVQDHCISSRFHSGRSICSV